MKKSYSTLHFQGEGALFRENHSLHPTAISLLLTLIIPDLACQIPWESVFENERPNYNLYMTASAKCILWVCGKQHHFICEQAKEIWFNLFFLMLQTENKQRWKEKQWVPVPSWELDVSGFQIPGNSCVSSPHCCPLCTFCSPPANLSWFLLLETMRFLIWETVTKTRAC